MKKILTLLCFIASMQTAFAQDIDSLLAKIAVEKNDNIRVEMLFNFFSKPAETDPVLALKNVQKLLIYSQEKKTE
jgi:hypothetical protein